MVKVVDLFSIQNIIGGRPSLFNFLYIFEKKIHSHPLSPQFYFQTVRLNPKAFYLGQGRLLSMWLIHFVLKNIQIRGGVNRQNPRAISCWKGQLSSSWQIYFLLQYQYQYYYFKIRKAKSQSFFILGRDNSHQINKHIWYFNQFDYFNQF